MTLRPALSTSARYPIIAAGFRPYWQGISFHGNEVTASQTRITIQPWATYIVFTVGACCPAKPDPPPVSCAHGDRMCVNPCTQAVHTTSSTVIRPMTTPFPIICGFRYVDSSFMEHCLCQHSNGIIRSHLLQSALRVSGRASLAACLSAIRPDQPEHAVG